MFRRFLPFLACFPAILWLVGCTVAPAVVPASSVAYSGNVQNGGILSTAIPIGDMPVKISGQLVGKFASLARKYGPTWLPEVHPGDGIAPQPDGTYLITKEYLSIYATMNILEQSAIKP